MPLRYIESSTSESESSNEDTDDEDSKCKICGKKKAREPKARKKTRGYVVILVSIGFTQSAKGHPFKELEQEIYVCKFCSEKDL